MPDLTAMDRLGTILGVLPESLCPGLVNQDRQFNKLRLRFPKVPVGVPPNTFSLACNWQSCPRFGPWLHSLVVKATYIS